MNLRCPYCGFKQRPLRVLLGAVKRRQVCENCKRTYVYRAPKELDPPFIDFGVAIVGLLVTVFVKSWFLWAVVIAGLVAVIYLRRVVLAVEPEEERTKQPT
jgi:uncharacterized protein (DUF983 family)